MIVFGFDIDTHATVIKDRINDFLSVGSRQSKVLKVDTFTDPAASGFMEFEAVPAKKGFYKKIKDHGVKLPNGKTLGLDNNEPFEVRKLNRQLGQVKFQIDAKTENQLEDIEIVRDKGIVKVKGKVVVEADDNGTVQYKDNAIEALVRG